MNFRKLFLFSAVVIFSFVMFSQKVNAATRTWDGGGGADTNWSTAANWSTDTVPVAADTVVFDATSGNNSTIDAGYVGTIATFTISSGYTGTITLAQTLVVLTSFSQAGGTFTAAAQTLDMNGSFTLSGGTFTASSGTISLAGAMTISGGTFNHNSGTFIFDGTTTATLSCNNITFNTVTFAHTSGTKTANSNCSLPLGNNPTLGLTGGNGNVTLLGTLTGTGTLTTIGTFTSSSTNPLSGFLAASSTAFSLTAGIFTAPVNMTVSGNFTISGGTSDANSGTLTFIGGTGTLSCNNAVFNLVVFLNTTSTKTINSNCNLPLGNNPSLGLSGNGNVTLLGTLTGTGTLTTLNTFTASSTNPLSGFSSMSSFVFAQTAGTFIAPASTTISSTFNVSGGIFDATTGTTTFNGGTATLTCNLTTSFGSVVISNTTTKTIMENCAFPLGNNPTISNSVIVRGTLSGTGTLTASVGTFTASGTNPLSGFSELLVSAFTQTAGTFTAPASTTVSGNFTISSGTFDANGGTLTFNGTSGTLSCNNATFNLVAFANTGSTKTANSNCNLPLGNNPSVGNGGNITLLGTLTGTGTITTTGTFTASSTNPLSGFSGLIANAVTLNGGILDIGNYTIADIDGILRFNSGTFVAPSGTLTLGGSWTNVAGTTQHNNGTVILDGTNQDIRGTNTFYNLIKTSTTPATLQFSSSGPVQTILNNLTFQGAPGAILSLRSLTVGSQYSLDAQGTKTLSCLDVQDSDAITPLRSIGIDSGNNTNWTFDAVPIIAVATSNSSGGGKGYLPGYGPTVTQVAPIQTSQQGCIAGFLFNTLTGQPCVTGNVSPGQNTYTFTRDLQLGTVHPEVKALQQYLNAQGFTVSTFEAGSVGNETTLFGSLTKAALSKFQKAKGIVPAVGYFGTITRNYISTH